MTGEFSGSESRSYAMLDHPEVCRVLFHPRRDLPDRPLPRHVHPLRIEVDEGIAVSGRLHRARPNGPTILYFHGNGELASDYDGIGPLYTQMGINLLVMDYRGYGLSDDRPTATHLVSDAVTVYAKTAPLLAEHGLSRRRLFVMGRSLGSAAAIEIAAHAGEKIAGLIIESGFAYTLPLLATLGLRMDRLRQLAGSDEAREGSEAGFGNLDKIAWVRVPTLIIHGEADWLIPVENGRALYEHCGAANKRLVTIPHAGHNDLLFVGQTTYFEVIRGFVLGGEKWNADLPGKTAS